MSKYDFGNYICELREKKGLSQTQLGEKLGVTNKAVSRWENGGAYPSTELMLPLAEALGVTIEDLYKVISESKAPKTKTRQFLEFFAGHSKLITLVCAILAAVHYALYAAVYHDGNIAVLIFIPVVCLILYFAIYLCLVLARKSPFSSAKAMDIYTIIIMAVAAWSYLVMLINLLSDFYGMLSPGFCFTITLFVSAVHSLKRRYK